MNYCWECGAALVETKSGPYSYETRNGMPRFKYTRRCPKRGRFTGRRHTEVTLMAFTDHQADAASEWDWHSGWD